jgi:hypothetical protein
MLLAEDGTMAATRNDWRITPLPEARASLVVDRAYSTAEFAQIKEGRIPEEMEDKWFVFYEEPWLYLHRSWTGYGIYQVRFEPTDDGARAREAVVNRDTEQYYRADDRVRRAYARGLVRLRLVRWSRHGGSMGTVPRVEKVQLAVKPTSTTGTRCDGVWLQIKHLFRG